MYGFEPLQRNPRHGHAHFMSAVPLAYTMARVTNEAVCSPLLGQLVSYEEVRIESANFVHIKVNILKQALQRDGKARCQALCSFPSLLQLSEGLGEINYRIL